jgi:hypothetical protein
MKKMPKGLSLSEKVRWLAQRQDDAEWDRALVEAAEALEAAEKNVRDRDAAQPGDGEAHR